MMLSSGYTVWAGNNIEPSVTEILGIERSSNPINVCPNDIRVYRSDFGGLQNIYKTISIVNTSSSTVVVTCKTKIDSSTYAISVDDISMVGGTISIPPNSERKTQIMIDASVVGQFKGKLLFSNNLNGLITTVPIYTKDVSDDSFPNPNYKPLTISPSEVNLTGTPGNQLVSKKIQITNNHTKRGTISFTVKSIYGCTGSILSTPKSISLEPGETKNIYITLRIPEYGDAFQVDLEMKHSENNTKTILSIYNVTKMLTIKNIKHSYNYFTQDFTITWDLLPYVCKYRIYHGTAYELANAMETDKGKHVIKNVTPDKAVNLYRRLVAVDQTDRKISYDAIVEYYENSNPYFPTPTNAKVTYDDVKGKQVLTWDPPQGEATNKYLVKYYLPEDGGYTYQGKVVDGTKLEVAASPTDDIIYSIRAQSPTNRWGIPITVQYIPTPQNISCLYDSERKSCKLTWENSSSNVESFKVYSSYNGSSYQLEQEISGLSYTKNGVNANDVIKYRFKVIPVHSSGIMGEGVELSLIDKNLVSVKRINAHIILPDRKAKFSWDALPGAKSYKVYGSINGSRYILLKIITGETAIECDLNVPPNYPSPDSTLSIKVKATNLYSLNQKDVIKTITFPNAPFNPYPGRP